MRPFVWGAGGWILVGCLPQGKPAILPFTFRNPRIRLALRDKRPGKMIIMQQEMHGPILPVYVGRQIRKMAGNFYKPPLKSGLKIPWLPPVPIRKETCDRRSRSDQWSSPESRMSLCTNYWISTARGHSDFQNGVQSASLGMEIL
jgi:hypothetical protein